MNKIGLPTLTFWAPILNTFTDFVVLDACNYFFYGFISRLKLWSVLYMHSTKL